MSIRGLCPDELSSSTQRVFVLFSGHNDRAVVALCRFFAAHSLPFVIVCSYRSDAIDQTDWANRSVFSRIDRTLDILLFDAVSQAVRSVYGEDARPVYCPTTEFMNHFVLQERTGLQRLGWVVTLPAADVYAELTSKARSKYIVEQLIGVTAPAQLSWINLRAPCVLKPCDNVSDGTVFYPRLCSTQDELKQALSEVDSQNWFAQNWIDGQSYYLCAYITADGRHQHFWQQNLLQQPGGKSIVFARTITNPGVVIDHLFQGLVDRGYHGPLMMELIQDESGRFHYIEINPRFWGPLQLVLDACPNMLRLFAHDAGVKLNLDSNSVGVANYSTCWYAWKLGAQITGCRGYPALAQVESTQSLPALLDRWDVYARPDTRSLQGRY